MSAKHRDPEYRRNSAIIRQQVAKARRLGQPVTCWRCGNLIHPEAAFDVGHKNPAGGNGLANLAPEHRYRTGMCQGNRAAGGRMGRAMQTAPRRPAPSAPPSNLIGWAVAVFFWVTARTPAVALHALPPLNSRMTWRNP